MSSLVSSTFYARCSSPDRSLFACDGIAVCASVQPLCPTPSHTIPSHLIRFLPIPLLGLIDGADDWISQMCDAARELHDSKTCRVAATYVNGRLVPLNRPLRVSEDTAPTFIARTGRVACDELQQPGVFLRCGRNTIRYSLSCLSDLFLPVPSRPILATSPSMFMRASSENFACGCHPSPVT